MDTDEEDTIDAHASSHSQTEHHKKRRRKHPNRTKQQQVDIGSITDAATNIEMNKMMNSRIETTVSHRKTTQQQSISDNHNNHDEQQLPALILEHAGTHSKWFCHGPWSSASENTILDNQSNRPISTDADYLSEREMKYYLCHLLIALDALHAAGIMHRDVKPRNCLINFPAWNNQESGLGVIENNMSKLSMSISSVKMPTHLPPPALMLVDLGLADFYLPGKEYNVRVASRHYKSPELLIGYSHYDYAIDMWSVGE
jgi:hypothetical protein